MKYFAYGSNMSLARLRARAPSVNRLGTYCLPEHKLTFNKVGNDGSGKCDAMSTGDSQDRIFGALYEIADDEKALLDEIEGLGQGYDEKIVKLKVIDGTSDLVIEAVMYYATSIKQGLLPYPWYLNHVLVGASETLVPTDYLQGIAQTQVIEDSDKVREQAEFDVHLSSQ